MGRNGLSIDNQSVWCRPRKYLTVSVKNQLKGKQEDVTSFLEASKKDAPNYTRERK